MFAATLCAVAQSEVLLPVGSLGARQHQAKSADTLLGLPFFDDFANYTGAPNPALWRNRGAAVGSGYALLPPTVGMLVLDAYTDSGMLYSQATTLTFPADTVASAFIKLDTCAVGDSVVLSFYYAPGGGSGALWARLGDEPEAGDSLVLDFYNGQAWQTVWKTPGVSIDTLLARTGSAWQYVAIGVWEQFLVDSFSFRFRNYCSIDYDSKTGRMLGGDQWNVDYVLLGSHRTVADGGTVRDVAFADVAPSMLAVYRAMPARQFRATDMAQQLSLSIRNLYGQPLASHYSYIIIDQGGTEVHRYDGGYDDAPASGLQTASAHASPTVGYAFTTSNAECRYSVVHVVQEGAAGDAHPCNDTVRYQQVFENYFAYDDGTAENGYGVSSTASRIYLAYAFTLNQADTITAVDMYFNRTFEEQNAAVQFYVTLWSVGDDGTPDQVIYHDNTARTPQPGVYAHYVLERGVVVPSGEVFVGFEQVGNDFINIGFDRSHNTADRIYYLASSHWQQSILSGSLMLRPYVGSRAMQVGISQCNAVTPVPTLYPNPASQWVYIGGVGSDAVWQMFDYCGRLVLSGVGSRACVAQLPAGVYHIRVQANGQIHTSAVVVKH